MSSYWPKANHGMVAEYQQSGVPYVTSSHATSDGESFIFPFVTRWVMIANDSGADIKVGFTQNGIDSNPFDNYLVVKDGVWTDRLELKCQRIFVKGTYSAGNQFSILAGLTNVEPSQFFAMTGSKGVAGVG